MPARTITFPAPLSFGSMLRSLRREPRVVNFLMPLLIGFFLLQMLSLAMIVTESAQSILAEEGSLTIDLLPTIKDQDAQALVAALQSVQGVSRVEFKTPEVLLDEAVRRNPDLGPFLMNLQTENPFAARLVVTPKSAGGREAVTRMLAQERFGRMIAPQTFATSRSEQERTLRSLELADGIGKALWFLMALATALTCLLLVEHIGHWLSKQRADFRLLVRMGSDPLHLSGPLLARLGFFLILAIAISAGIALLCAFSFLGPARSLMDPLSAPLLFDRSTTLLLARGPWLLLGELCLSILVACTATLLAVRPLHR